MGILGANERTGLGALDKMVEVKGATGQARRLKVAGTACQHENGEKRKEKKTKSEANCLTISVG